jgi:hypothetical protein
MKKLMSLLSRRELLRSIIQRYRAAGRKDKQRILDEFVEATGYHRKYAVALLHKTAESPLTTERKPRQLMNSPLPADLLDLKARFDHWRSTRPYIRQQIPDELRHAALEMSGRYTPALVGRVLKLDPSRLKKPVTKQARLKTPLIEIRVISFTMIVHVATGQANS